ncbi:tRNA uridine-5-carboxymethylaminomethyl(34) synthesis GTPase MnmE [Denitrobaculum tricleocarpae]|uniref:tRNA modification GTPase MnmE n=1 Tax=Denitrobaculum tricleocarpae TaxID=2591009 RepID=A0A545TRH0_9PROT|nr:tRNA uridine-5-carboxymethylaminomethyl(34) synthesis GTPase MnmE [Denitrobaculum tricleocarpae]TQV79827.1 tRNA uridine-5-carboxymethylaminomethyl(34) synthesis GTPase MnmE [Denitrobaculum tricleocarpae]
MNDTIFALSTAAGVAGVAVFRISGPQAGNTIEALAGVRPVPRMARLLSLRDPVDSAEIDRALVLWFPAPQSFTGEDVVELHVHGGRSVVAGVVKALSAMSGLRAAEAGEFTRRAFDNGKLDLSEVEGLADLISAETEAQRRQALRQMDGALSNLSESWKQRLLRILAHIEAVIDFPDEDLPESVAVRLQQDVSKMIAELARYLDDEGVGERLRDGLALAIVGAPNAGKSSLLNVLAKRDAAIVSEMAGTTRDVVEVHLDLDGYPMTLADTAGLRDLRGDGQAAIEAEGIRRARARAAAADMKIAVFDLNDWPRLDPATLDLVDASTIVVLNKRDMIDLLPDLAQVRAGPLRAAREVLAISARDASGMTDLISVLRSRAQELLTGAGEAPVITRSRHRTAFEDCLASLRRAQMANVADDPELLAEDLRLAMRALGRIAGRVDVEDLLDVVFRDFCIGK